MTTRFYFVPAVDTPQDEWVEIHGITDFVIDYEDKEDDMAGIKEPEYTVKVNVEIGAGFREFMEKMEKAFGALNTYVDADDPWELPAPVTGEHVWVETRGGDIFVGVARSSASNNQVKAITVEEVLFLILEEGMWGSTGSKYDIVAWGLCDPADLVPDEPEEFGYVGYVVDAEDIVWDVMRYGMTGVYILTRRTDGRYNTFIGWQSVLNVGKFTEASYE